MITEVKAACRRREETPGKTARRALQKGTSRPHTAGDVELCRRARIPTDSPRPATYGDPGSIGGLISLRVWENGVTTEIAFEGQDFGQDENGDDVKILEIEQIRVAGRGDTAATCC